VSCGVRASLSPLSRFGRGSLVLYTDLAIVTAHPFDMSTTRQQAAIKKFRASPVYRLVVEPDEQAQRLGMNRGKMLTASMSMGRAGMPAREGNPSRDEFPCNYCAFRTLDLADGPDLGLMFPPIPESMSVKPYEAVA
jgi:hypothetical protein